VRHGVGLTTGFIFSVCFIWSQVTVFDIKKVFLYNDNFIGVSKRKVTKDEEKKLPRECDRDILDSNYDNCLPPKGTYSYKNDLTLTKSQSKEKKLLIIEKFHKIHLNFVYLQAIQKRIMHRKIITVNISISISRLTATLWKQCRFS